MKSIIEEYQGKALILTRSEEQVDNSIWKTLNTVISVTPDMFHNMGTKNKPQYYPGKALTNLIGSAMGIEFSSDIRVEYVYGTETTHPDGTKTKEPVGVRCIKQGKRRRPDGTMQVSSPCPYTFNWIDRAEEDFLKDMDNIGQKWPDGNPMQKYNFPDNPQKEKIAQRRHILELKKHAEQRASTGAELIVIRELSGMQTSFTESDLKDGIIVVSQIAKSDEYQKLEARAKLDNLRLGGSIASSVDEASSLLTGDSFGNEFDRPTPAEKPEEKPPVAPSESAKDIGVPEYTAKPVPGEKEYEALIEKANDEIKNFLEDERQNNPQVAQDLPGFYKWAIDTYGPQVNGY